MSWSKGIGWVEKIYTDCVPFDEYQPFKNKGRGGYEQTGTWCLKKGGAPRKVVHA